MPPSCQVPRLSHAPASTFGHSFRACCLSGRSKRARFSWNRNTLHDPGRRPQARCQRQEKDDIGIRNGPPWRIGPRKPCTTVAVVQVITRDGAVPLAIPGGWLCRSPIHGASMSTLDDLETGWTSGGWMDDTPLSSEPLPPPPPLTFSLPPVEPAEPFRAAPAPAKKRNSAPRRSTKAAKKTTGKSASKGGKTKKVAKKPARKAPKRMPAEKAAKRTPPKKAASRR